MKSSSKGSSSASAAAIDRKTIEKNRRIHMKSLCFKLVSLIPPTSTDHQNHSSKKDIPQTDLIDQAANYIQEQRKRIDKLKIKKDLLTTTTLPSTTNNTKNDDCGDQDIITSNAVVAATSTCSSNASKETDENLINLPILQVRDFDTNTLEVVLITGMNKHFMYYQLITALEEEGAEVVNASFASVSDKIFYTVHSQVRAGVETPRICDRLKKLVS
ncbi:hypothetical protein MKW98_027954 [Papaver atlanticum]|uniref:BHLH domain-containing protein n=1 Tax=Papaver atlanticum TaxID=357466 RepID=A0AAD4SKR6_9MAGN|nr:hypothetical protein MKW98_027954 [Papaver atlanticum]